MWKIDGNSLSLIYRDGKLVLAKTRGNGTVGEDVTDKARWVSEILPTLPVDGAAKGEVEVRGELVCLQSRFGDLAIVADEKPRRRRRFVVEKLAGRLGDEEPTAEHRERRVLAGEAERLRTYRRRSARGAEPCASAAGSAPRGG